MNICVIPSSNNKGKYMEHYQDRPYYKSQCKVEQNWNNWNTIVLFYHSEIKKEVNNRKVIIKSLKPWKLSNVFLNHLQFIKENIGELEFVKVKTVCFMKDTVKKMKTVQILTNIKYLQTICPCPSKDFHPEFLKNFENSRIKKRTIQLK
jgi:hypothetical protein